MHAAEASTRERRETQKQPMTRERESRNSNKARQGLRRRKRGMKHQRETREQCPKMRKRQANLNSSKHMNGIRRNHARKAAKINLDLLAELAARALARSRFCSIRSSRALGARR